MMTYFIINNFSTRTLTTIPTTDTDTSTKRLVGYYGDEDLHKKKNPNSATKSAITTFPFFYSFCFFSLYNLSDNEAIQIHSILISLLPFFLIIYKN